MLSRIGSGGMAEVFRAQDDILDRPVAVKVFRAEHVANGDAHGVERQQLEVAALARLNHPNLIALYDGSIGGSSDGDSHAYIVMELIDGPPLSERIAAGPLPEASAREIGIQIADGLAYVHSQGMVHRDVKPENILLGIDRSDDDSTVRARLSDFGIVRLLGSERLTNVNFTLGTASYLAPEQARGADVEPPADVYALGLVLLEALTGQRAYTGTPLEAAMARLSQRPTIPADLPEPWPGLLYAMTEFDPAMRPSAAEVARILRNEGSRSLPLVPLAVPVAAGFTDAPTGMVAAVPPPPGSPGDPTGAVATPGRRKRRVNPLVVAAIVSLLVIGTTLGIFLLTGNDSQSPASTPTHGNSTSAAGEQPRSDHPETRSTGANNHPVVGVPSAVVKHHPTATRSASVSAPASSAAHSSAPATHSSAPSTSAAPSTPTHSSTAPPTSSQPPSTSGSPTSAGSTASSPGSSSSPSSSPATSSQSPNARTTTSAG